MNEMENIKGATPDLLIEGWIILVPEEMGTILIPGIGVGKDYTIDDQGVFMMS